MKTKFQALTHDNKQLLIPVTICDGIRSPFAADLIGFAFSFGKKCGSLQVFAKIQSAGYGEENVQVGDVHDNF